MRLLQSVMVGALVVCSAVVVQGANQSPYQNVVRAFVSANGQHSAACTKTGDKFRVIVDGRSYGPYDDVDTNTISPFDAARPMWAFRAVNEGNSFLVVNGTTYGPYKEVWPVSSNGQSWGALIKQDAKYYLLVDGRLSAGFDEVVGDHRSSAAFSLLRHSTDMPLFYGQSNWVAFARNGNDLFIVTRQKTYGPFIAIGDEEFSKPEPSAAELNRNLSFDRSTLAVAVTKADASGGKSHYLWINGVEQGPLDLIPEFAALGYKMSMNGRRWAVFDETSVLTSEGRRKVTKPHQTYVSDNGLTSMYSFGDDGDARFVVNGREYGPYQSVSGISCSPDGRRWVANYRPLNDPKSYAMTESGPTAPQDVFPMSIGAFFIGNDWIWVTKSGDNGATFLINGKSYGPYHKGVSFPVLFANRITDKTWGAYAVRDQGVDIFTTGKLLTSTKPFVPTGILHSNEPHWHMLGKIDDKRCMVEDGKITMIPDAVGVVGEFHSGNDSKFALHSQDAQQRNFVVFSDKTFGPYEKIAGKVQFSFDGSQWAFTVADGELTKVVTKLGESPSYQAVRDLTVTAQGTSFVGLDAEGKWWLHRGSQRTGPFEAAGLTESAGRITTMTVSVGVVSVQSDGGNTNCCCTRRRLFGRRR